MKPILQPNVWPTCRASVSLEARCRLAKTSAQQVKAQRQIADPATQGGGLGLLLFFDKREGRIENAKNFAVVGLVHQPFGDERDRIITPASVEILPVRSYTECSCAARRIAKRQGIVMAAAARVRYVGPASTGFSPMTIESSPIQPTAPGATSDRALMILSHLSALLGVG